jgi:hypothetical protein
MESKLKEHYGNGKYLDEWLNSAGQRHRTDGPAYIWYKNGAVTLEIWYLNGKKHRLDGPAEISYNNGAITNQYWYINGVMIERDRQAKERQAKERQARERQERERQARRRKIKVNAELMCPPVVSIDHNNFTAHITVVEGQIFYKGTPAALTIGEKIGVGAYGKVELAMLDTSEGPFKCAVKTGMLQMLEEVKAYRSFPEALTCEGILNFVPISDTAILMLLATGDINDMTKKLSLDQICQILLVIGEQLACLLHHGVKYFDVKPENVLYFCRGSGQVDISLSDLGSVVANRYYPSPYVLTGNQPLSSISLDLTTKYYTFLLLNFISEMLRGSFIILSDCQQSVDALIKLLNEKYRDHAATAVIIAEAKLIRNIKNMTPFTDFLDKIYQSLITDQSYLI